MLSRWSRGGVPVFSRPHRNPNAFERLGELARRRLAGAARRPLLRPDVDQAVEERAGRDDERRGSEALAVLELETRSRRRHPTRMRPALPKIQSMFGTASSALLHPGAVAPLVGLRARRPDRRTAAAVEQLELDAGRVDRAAHQAAERVDLADEMAFRRSADRRIARHVRDGAVRQRADRRRGGPGARPPTPLRRRRAPRR